MYQQGYTLVVLKTLRHVLAILLLPVFVVLVVPAWLFRAFADYDTRWVGMTSLTWTGIIAGTLSAWVGFILFIWCVNLFAIVGQGTLAPWDPTQKLVVLGPYRLVRNPMISGVAMMLIGQSLFWGSWVIALWAGIFILVNHVYFIVSEEPGLEKRFGERYLEYKARVPRWFPRLKP
jgi:protein-S-isoprenylcysteine O-methyltransferase Ste14